MDDLTTLERLGLTQYESRVFLALLRRGPSTARAIVQESKVPKNKAYEVLARLEKRNLIVTLPITPRRYKIENFEKLTAILDEKQKELLAVKKELERLEKVPQSPVQEYQEFFWVIKGQKRIQEKISLETVKMKKEILSVNRLSKYLPKNLRTMKDAVRRGVKVRMICQVAPDNETNVWRWKETGAELRVYRKDLFGEIMPRFTVFDNKSLRITIGKPEVRKEEEYLSLFTESPTLATLFRNYFFSMWEKSIPLEKHKKSRR